MIIIPAWNTPSEVGEISCISDALGVRVMNNESAGLGIVGELAALVHIPRAQRGLAGLHGRAQCNHFPGYD